MQLRNQNLLHFWDFDRPHIFNQYLSRSIYMVFGKSGSFFQKKYQIYVKNSLIAVVWFKIKKFPIYLANQNLLQYWNIDGHQLFNQNLIRSFFIIFGKSGSFKKGIKFKIRLISGVRFKIKTFQKWLSNQNLLQYWEHDGPQVFNQYLNSNILMSFGKSRSFEKKGIKYKLNIWIFQMYFSE